MSPTSPAFARAMAALGPMEGDALLARLETHLPDALPGLAAVYGSRTDLDALVVDLLDVVGGAAERRPAALRRLDRRREINPDWFQSPSMIGYVAYTDRYAKTLAGVRNQLDYLDELGVTYLHLMPLLQAREGDSDGGYAVEDYGAVEPRLGSMADLEALAADLHERGISLCIDLVLNHTAAEHRWARAAAAGDPAYRDFYLIYPDRSEPDAYERTLPEVFPDNAPGSFTDVPGVGVVWTTFNTFQWDLNWANPQVLVAMLEVLVDLANRGVDVLRLDAAPFLWKRLGTNCQNQPEAHLIVQILRALVRIAAPAVAFKAEAIVAPDDLVQYLGAHEHYRPECDLAYHNQLMVMLWSSIATRDARLATVALRRLRPAPPESGWVTYVRCHDDIGWAVSDEDAWAVGWNPFEHRRFLAAYFAGRVEGSFARGALFQENPATGDARTSGSTAALCGLEQALLEGDEAGGIAGVRRLLLLYSVVYSFGGIPLVYMGDELGLFGDEEWAALPSQAGDNRWMHRPHMDWVAAQRRHDPETVEGQVFTGLRALGAVRRTVPSFGLGGATQLLDSPDPRLLAYLRTHPRGDAVLVVANVGDQAVTVTAEWVASVLWAAGAGRPGGADRAIVPA
ncbi:MAG: alpha-amylase family glycosyl hydrolase, partial [Actinomycetota bacterium]|nr:alpha-amylase family glycosyl hydrolase [Actinomycetota bacterium]